MANENPELDTLVEGAPQQEPTVNVELTVNELNVVFASLQELPHRVADPILKKLFQQAQAQLGQPQG
jgi:hypothetical protein